jgi:hypothetical protein
MTYKTTNPNRNLLANVIVFASADGKREKERTRKSLEKFAPFCASNHHQLVTGPLPHRCYQNHRCLVVVRLVRIRQVKDNRTMRPRATPLRKLTQEVNTPVEA